MKERPILFSGAMVRALLDGSKTQTRRPVKWRKPAEGLNMAFTGLRTHYYPGGWVLESSSRTSYEWRSQTTPCPYGQAGDRLWVRETWQGPLLKEFETDADADWHTPAHIHQYQNPAHCAYAADGGPAPEFSDLDDNLQQRWRPSIHMPRWASRINLAVTAVRVERLQAISEGDALAEGIAALRGGGYGLPDTTFFHATDPRQSYWALWEHINGAGSVEKNPFVWVLDFLQPTNPAQP